MVMTDPIADMLTRIRNALVVKHEQIQVPASNMKKAIADILLKKGYIKGYTVIDDGHQGILKITLKYAPNNERVITGLKRISKPGLRVYARKDEIPKVLGGLRDCYHLHLKGCYDRQTGPETGCRRRSSLLYLVTENDIRKLKTAQWKAV
jgi:small subunit ribosomal protein S8